MKIRFVESIQKPSKPKVAEITFSKRVISFSKTAVEKLDIGNGNHVALFQDEEKPNDWYVVFNALSDRSVPLKINSFGKANGNHPNAYKTLAEYFRISKPTFSISIGGGVKTEFGIAHVLITAPLIEHKILVESVPMARKEATHA